MINGKSVLAVVTARAGSKGLPGKNYRELLGKPLVLWSAIAGEQSVYVDRTYVSTNCHHVKRAFADYSFSVHTSIVDRPPEFSTDTSKNEEALLHAVQTWEARHGDLPDIVVNLQPTSPARTNRLLDKCLKAMCDGDADSLLTVTKETPFFWRKEGDKYEPTYDLVNRPMRQEIAPDEWFFKDNGNIYAFNTGVLIEKKCRVGDRPFLYVTDEFQSMQIDTELDFRIFEILASERGLL